jgi:ribose transport system permease protein
VELNAPKIPEANMAAPRQCRVPGRGLLARHVAPIVLLTLTGALLAIGEVLAPGFATLANALQLLKLSSFLGIVAIGQTIVVLTGGIDLSIAWVLATSAIVFAGICQGQNARIALAAAAALIVGLVAGLANGFGVAKLRISPIVMTLAMNGIMQGAILVYTQGTPVGVTPDLLRDLTAGSIGPLPFMVILWAALAIVTIVAVSFTTGGRRLLSVGENPRASLLSGINNDAVIIAAYVVSGFSTALAGILFVGFSGASFLGMGDEFLLPTIVAVVLGGTSIFGGRGGYSGTAVAVFFVTILTTVLSIENISPGIQNIAFGIVVIVAVVLQRFTLNSEFPGE